MRLLGVGSSWRWGWLEQGMCRESSGAEAQGSERAPGSLGPLVGLDNGMEEHMGVQADLVVRSSW